MKDLFKLFVLTFIVIIAVIVLARDLTTAMLIISLLTNLIVMTLCLNKIRSRAVPAGKQPAGPSGDKSVDPPNGKPSGSGHNYEPSKSVQDGQQNDSPDVITPMYASDELIADDFKNSYFMYPKASPCGVGAPLDMANIAQARNRARDKKCSDGWATKTSNYYKAHYGDEFEESEAADWWGHMDY